MTETGQIAASKAGTSEAASRQVASRLRRRQITGLILLLAVILIASIYHAGLAQVFPKGWWRFW